MSGTPGKILPTTGDWFGMWSYGIERVNPVALVVRVAHVILVEVSLTSHLLERFSVRFGGSSPGLPNRPFRAHACDSSWRAWGGCLFLLGTPGKECAEVWMGVWGRCSVSKYACLCSGPRQRQLHVAGPAPPLSWPTFFSPFMLPL